MRRLLARLAIALLPCLLALATQPASGAAPPREVKKILLLYYSFGANSVNARSIRAALESRADEHLEIYEAPFSRAADENAMDRYAEYLGALFADKKLDLTVAIGSPAVTLFQRNRARFPTTKLLALAEARRLPSSGLTPDDVIFSSWIDLPGIAQNVMRLLPDTTNVEVVVGSSASERDWFEQFRTAFAPYADKASLRGLNDYTFDEMLEHVSKLAPHSALVFLLFLTDAAGQTYEDTKVLARLREVANAPIFTFYDGSFGQGIVGGPLIAVQERSRMVADSAVRMLRGENAASINPPRITAAARPKFDWRELQRWGIDEARLPPNSDIYFRPPSMWEQYRVQIMAVVATFLAQAILITWLIYEHRRRQKAEMLARDTISELTQMNRIAAAGQLSGSIAHEVSQPVTAMIANANAAIRWLTLKVPDVAEARSALKRIVDAGHRAGNIIQNIRAMFNKDKGEKKQVQINQLVESVLDLLRIDLQKQDVDVMQQLADGLPDVYANPIQLQQVLLNLVLNALEAMSSVRDRALQIRSGFNERGWLQVSIEDTGPGVAPSNVDRIFDPLYSTKDHGMGMGLAICRTIIESHQGRMWVSARPSGGASFQFELPPNNALAAATPHPPEQTQAA